MAIPVARGEVHSGEDAVLGEGRVDQARALHERGPVEPGEEAHARDHVADRHVHLGLALVLAANGLLRCRALGGEPLLQPAKGGSRSRILVAQPLEELHARGGREPDVGQSGQRPRGVHGLSRPEAQQLIRERVGLFARCPAAHDPLSSSAQVLHQYDPQADRDRPQLAHGEGLDALVREHHPAEALRVKPAVRVRDVGPCNAEDSRIASEMSLRKLRELAIVIVGQVVANLAQLLVDDVEVVNEPLRSGSDRALLPDRVGERSVGVQKDPAVVREARHDGPTRTGFAGDTLGRGERFGVLLEALDAEQLRDDRRLGITGRRRITRRLRGLTDREAIDGPLAETLARRSGRGPQLRAAASCSSLARSIIG